MGKVSVGVALSGGVDSAMAASLLLEQGYEVRGFFMHLPLPGLKAQVRRVQEVANQLSIPLIQVDMRQRFSEEIIAYFTATYRAGLTPNPCVRCNQTIKFGLLAQAMQDHGLERMATGHYARIEEVGGQPFVARGGDRLKDQSYFLARLSGPQLQRTLFPLGNQTKPAMYARAAELGFNFQGEESQDVCFLPAGLAVFLAQQGIGEATGPILTRDGRQLGTHRGVWHYTIGQRRGLGLPDATPWYVLALDGRRNQVVVGKQEELFAEHCLLKDLDWIHQPPSLPWHGQVQLRSRHTPVAARLTAIEPGSWRLRFAQPQRAVTPGQFAVFYEEDRVVASAVIAGTREESAA